MMMYISSEEPISFLSIGDSGHKSIQPIDLACILGTWNTFASDPSYYDCPWDREDSSPFSLVKTKKLWMLANCLIGSFSR